MEQLVPGTIQSTDDLETKASKVNNAWIQQSQFCFSHGQMCETLRPVDVDMSGMPCQDNSRANHKRKFERGERFDTYLVWAKKHRVMKTPLIILENTSDIRLDPIQRLLPEYFLYQLHVTPGDVGYQGDATSVWYALNDREKTLVQQLDASFEEKFGRSPVSDSSLVYFLGDRFEYSKTWSATSHAIPCYRRGKAKYLHRAAMQFLTSYDKLASLGWPVSPEMAENMLCTKFPCADVYRADSVVGNSMHVANASVVLLLRLACFAKRTPAQLAS
ncbi:unnamed protein product [Effrenium voratum]|nr:unnamed protein product [Effrenium voratum]